MNAPLLQAARVVETISRLQERIDSRFPGSGLSRLCGALQQTAQSARERSEQLGRPFIAIRMLTWILVVLLIVAIGTAIASLGIRWRAMDVTELDRTSRHRGRR